MLVSLTSTTPDATDLGFLLHKHPDRVRSVDVGFGRAHVFYPQASPQRCTATLFVEVDPIALSRGQHGRRSSGLEPYVNDRPYAASSLLSVALGRLYRTAMSGTCEARPELVETAARPRSRPPRRAGSRWRAGASTAVSSRWATRSSSHRSRWTSVSRRGATAAIFSVRLSGRHRVRHTLEHLFVLLPVLDDRKHYWIDQNEIDKLLRRGGDWLGSHPESELISRRYLRFGQFAREALSRLADVGEDTDSLDEQQDEIEQAAERPISLREQRLASVLAAVRAVGGGRVVDLGCGEGRLLQRLVCEPSVTEVLGVDVSVGALERAERHLLPDEMSERRRERISLLQGALTYTDDRLCGFDVATVVEVIEHINSERLDVFAEVVFGHAAPTSVVLTTPNREYNVNFENLGPTGLRHGDHRFEWTRDEFAAWAQGIEDRFGYGFEISGIGHSDLVRGPPTQMAVFPPTSRA